MNTRLRSIITQRFLLLIAAAVLSITILPGTAKAGSGTFENGLFNFCVSVRFQATQAQLDLIKDRFERASQVLADATEGQHRFGIVTIVNNSGASSEAEFWIHPSEGRAYSNTDVYGVRGEHANMWFLSDFTGRNGQLNGVDADAFTIAHEFAHLAYGLMDEYHGGEDGEFAECAQLTDNKDLNFCLMDNFLSRGGRAGGGVNYTLNEFCVAGNHDPDRDTQQEKELGMSCWQTIAGHTSRGANAPGTFPLDLPPPAHDVTVNTNCCGGLRVMLVLDRSNSMEGIRLGYAKAAANLLVSMLKNGDAVGVASFAGDSSVNFPLTTITTNDVREAATLAINSLSVDSATNIGDGLLAGLGQITAQPQRSCKDIIVLLTDGEHTSGTPPQFVIPALQQAGVSVFSVTVGADAGAGDQSIIQNIANRTGGKYIKAADPDAMPAIFAIVAAESQEAAPTFHGPVQVSQGDVKEIPVRVEPGSASITFAVTVSNQSDEITLSTKSPSGVIVTSAKASNSSHLNLVSAQNGVAFASGPHSRILKVDAPESGIWKIVITAGTVTTGKLDVLAFTDHAGVQVNASVVKERLGLSETAEIHATPTFGGEAVLGATITAVVRRPDGSSVTINLFDDGAGTNGDKRANDGSYSARFKDYAGQGTYNVELTANSVNGMTYGGEALDLNIPSSAHPVPDFTRLGRTSLVIVPDRDVRVHKSAASATVAPGQNATYTIRLENVGALPVQSATVTDLLPDEATFVSCAATGGGLCNTSDITRPKITFTSFAPGKTESITIVANVMDSIPHGTRIRNAAFVVTTPVDLIGGNSTNVWIEASTTPPASGVKFESSSYSVSEAGGSKQITVTRSGATSTPATVNYATNDTFGTSCNTTNGQASANCDYNTAGGTLRFAAGETSKTIPLSIVDDGYVEGNEIFSLTLSNPTGMSLGSPATTTVTVVDNDATLSNPFETNGFFVRQQYLDFLLREPDTGGFNDWLSVLNNCPPNQGGLGSNPGCDRVHVSSGFFRSTEFGERGYWSYRYYHAALGRRPQFAEFVPDLRRLSGLLSPAEEEAARTAFVTDFMQRGEFAAIYGGLTTAANAPQFIAKLEEKAGVTLPATVPPTQPGQPPQYGRAELIGKMQSGQFTAAQTLRAFIEQKVVFDAFFFRAFVAMQYFGYLLRDPEDAGYNDWVDVLTNGRGSVPPGDFRHLIFGFVWSVEYRQRFGP